MSVRSVFHSGMAIALISSFAVYLLSSGFAGEAAGVAAPFAESIDTWAPAAVVSPKDLFRQGAQLPRFLTHISTDKPVYRPGEIVRVRAVLLGAIDGHPLLARKVFSRGRLQVVGPKKETIAEEYLDPPQSSVLAAQWTVPAGASGGDYVMKILLDSPSQPSGERKVSVRAFRSPKLKVTVSYDKRGYGPGDDIVGSVHVDRADGEPCVRGKLVFNAVIDGFRLTAVKVPASLDAFGDARFHFRMPPEVAGDGVGSVSVVVSDDGVVEGGAKSIPTILAGLDLYFFPEGGVLVPGLPSRVYFEARTNAQEPVEVEGELWQVGGAAAVAGVSAVHEGRGRFSFTPVEGAQYEVRISKPAGVQPVLLPAVQRAARTPGLVVSTRGAEEGGEDGGVVGAGEGVGVMVEALGAARKVQVAVYKREQELSSVFVEVGGGAGAVRAALSLPTSAAGVLRVTVWQGRVPLAERLVFRNPSRQLDVTVATNATSYSPRATVTLTATVRDKETLEPVEGAVVGLAVSDASTRGLVEERRLPPTLPSMALLEQEVKELTDPEAYLGSASHLDLLLGVQGWRRFVYLDPMQHLAADDADDEDDEEDAGDTGGRREDGMGKEKFERLLAVVAPAPEDLMWGGGVGGMAAGGAMDFAAFMMPMKMDAMAKPERERVPMAMPQLAMAEMAMEEADAAAAPAEDAAGGMALDLGPGLPPFVADAPAPPAPAEPEPAAAAPMDDDVDAADAMRKPPGARQAKKRVARPQRALAKRVYAHAVIPPQGGARANAQPRNDFTETLYWAAGLVTGKNGTVQATFEASDALSSYHAVADVHAMPWEGHHGTLGAWQGAAFRTEQQLTVDIKLPVSVIEGDRIDAPVTLAAGGGGDLVVEALDVEVGGAMQREGESAWRGLRVLRGGRSSVAVSLVVRRGQGAAARVAVSARALVAPEESKDGGPVLADAVERSIGVSPAGFPFAINKGALVDEHSPMQFAAEVPPSAGGVSLRVAAMTSPAASLLEALEGLLREPCGCFEQTSATTYPMVMALLYFEAHAGVPSELVARVEGLLKRGMARLKGFEVDGGGFEWFGQAPAHEALSAYGLMQFLDLAKVKKAGEVAPWLEEVIGRTRGFLSGRREDAASGFKLNPRHLDSFGGAPASTARGYIVWSLTQAGESLGLERQVEAVVLEGRASEDAYKVALAAGTAANLGRREEARALSRRVAGWQEEGGRVGKGETSITSSRGLSLEVETTALAALAWQRLGGSEFVVAEERAVGWLLEQCQGGRFGSTQATVLALKAIIAHDEAKSRERRPGLVRVAVDGVEQGSAAFDGDTKEAVVVTVGQAALGPGEHHVSVSMERGMPVPVAATLQYNAELPASSGASRVGLDVEIGGSGGAAVVLEGAAAEIRVHVRRKDDGDKPLGMVVAIVGVPGGLEVRADRLREGVDRGEFDMYELRPGNEAVLYWRSIDAEERKVTIEALATSPGLYTGKASRAYEYYADDDKTWAPPLRVTVTTAGV